jgi:hypothetical protein
VPQRSIRQRLAALDRQLLSAEDRFVALKLEVRTHAGERLFTVGGCWDTTARCYVQREVPAKVVYLKRSQERLGRVLGEQLRKRIAGDDTRKALIMMLGARGGGKTFGLALIVVCVALALPASWQQVVSIFGSQNAEVAACINQIADTSWSFEVTDPKQPMLEFINGSKCLWMTSRTPMKIRQAAINWEHIGVNEGQAQSKEVYVNAQGAVRNVGGFTSIAANPSTEDAGDWVVLLHQGLEAGSEDGVTIELPPADNDAVNQKTLGKNERLIRLVDEEAADADSRGVIKLSGQIGYRGFTKLPRRTKADGTWESGHIGERELIWDDVTREITAHHTRVVGGYDYVAGCDWQINPGCCATIGKLFRIRGTETILLWIKEFIGAPGREHELSLALMSKGYYPARVDHLGRPVSSLLLVGDATGARQNAPHVANAPYSFTIMGNDGWQVLPPDYVGKKLTPWNPLVPESRKQMATLLSSGLIVLSSACTDPQEGFGSLVDGFIRTKVNSNGRFVRKGHTTHGPDGVRYLSWRFLPRNGVDLKPRPLDREAFDELASISVLDG